MSNDDDDPVLYVCLLVVNVKDNLVIYNANV